MVSKCTQASPPGRSGSLPPAAAGRPVCNTLNMLGQAPGTATATGTHNTPQVGHLAPPQTRCTCLSGLLRRGMKRLHISSTTGMLGHTIQPSQVAHPLLLRSVLAANTKDTRYNLLLQWLPSVSLTYESLPSVILLPAAEALSPANRSNPSPQSCPRSPQWLGQPCPSPSPQPPPSPSPSPWTATTEQPSFPGSWEDGEREGNKTYWDRVLFFFKGIRREEFLFDSSAALDRCLWETVPEA